MEPNLEITIFASFFSLKHLIFAHNACISFQNPLEVTEFYFFAKKVPQGFKNCLYGEIFAQSGHTNKH